jgi:hypothetical protein
LNWVGGVTISSAPPNISNALAVTAGKLAFSKIFAPFSLLLAGLCAGFFFRQLRLAPLACVLGGLAVALSSQFFSTACWGVAAQVIALGMNFLALGWIVDDSRRLRWAKVILAGMAVGMGVMEGYDIGAIFSVCVAAFVLYHAGCGEGTRALRLARGVARVAGIAVAAGLIATQALIALVGTQIKGVVGTEQDTKTKEEKWDWATQWSYPPGEILRLVIPGLFGYRMDTPGGGAYWGRAGETPGYYENRANSEWLKTHPNAMPRFSGGGTYAGLLVVLLAAWAVAQSLRKKASIFTNAQRRLIWFWTAMAAVSLLLAFGRYAPFYQFVYMLPYFSTIRNPAKFTHTFHWALLILFAYGVHGCSRCYLERPAVIVAGLKAHFKNWWAKAGLFDKRWTTGCLGVAGASLLGTLIYASSRANLERHLESLGFAGELASATAVFSIKEVVWFLVFLVLTVGLVTLVVSGWLSGRRARTGGILLGALLVVDLARADLPWIIFWDSTQKYATNPIIETLRDKPYQHRVAVLPWWLKLVFQIPPKLSQAEQFFEQLYDLEWKQHLFPYYNVQSLDIIQMPRVPEDMAAFEGALQFRGPATLPLVPRRWQLTNTRYLVGAAGMLELLNQGIDPDQKRFRIVTQFDLALKPGVARFVNYADLTVVPATNGAYALFEFTGALPRAKLYSNWQVSTNDAATLQQLADPKFDPAQTVLVGSPLPSPPATGTNRPSAGTVEFVSYAPKHLVLQARAEAPSVLLLNDKFDPNWFVTVDGTPAPLLRCNYIMRGVHLSPGPHRIEFRFTPPVTGLWVSLAVLGVGLVLLVCVAAFGGTPPKSDDPPSPDALSASPVQPRPDARRPNPRGA